MTGVVAAATLEETRRLHDWALAEVMRRLTTEEGDGVVRSELESAVCQASSSKMASFVVRSTVNVLLALNVLTVTTEDGLVLRVNREQAACVENADHYSHLLHSLRREREALERDERRMIEELVARHTGGGGASKVKRRRQSSSQLLSPAVAEQDATVAVLLSPAEKHSHTQQAVQRVRELQAQLHAKRGLLESTVLAHTPGALAVPMSLGPLGLVHDPPSKFAGAAAAAPSVLCSTSSLSLTSPSSSSSSSSSQFSSNKRPNAAHPLHAVSLPRGFEMELRSTNVDFIGFVASQFEPWTGQHHSSSHHDTALPRSTSTPRLHSPRPSLMIATPRTASPSPSASSSSSQQHAWPVPQPTPPLVSSALKLPQWRASAGPPDDEQELTPEEREEEARLGDAQALLERHEAVLKDIRVQLDLAAPAPPPPPPPAGLKKTASMRSPPATTTAAATSPPPPPPQAPGATLTRSRRQV